MKNSHLIILSAIILALFSITAISGCKPETTATCTDGVKNGTETGVDCGGSCAVCATCSDGIQNGTETGIDCGGSCSACVDVYIAGREYANGYERPTYWKNDSAVHMIDVSTLGGFANAIAVSGNDIYVGGTYTNTALSEVAVYWKNGVKTDLSIQYWHSTVKDIAVSGSDVHVFGIIYHSPPFPEARPKYWKNGVETTLGVPGITAMAVSGNDVYFAGNDTVAAPNYRAACWKNGVREYLTDGTTQVEIKDIVVSGNDVYVAGYEMNGSSRTAKYWKNGVAVNLANAAEAVAITIAGSDVYITGMDYSSANAAAVYWKNGTKTNLTDGSIYTNTYSIAVAGTDVYVVGSETTGLGEDAVYWKNGVKKTLAPSSQYGQARAIVVLPR